jgi:hypothetical protein
MKGTQIGSLITTGTLICTVSIAVGCTTDEIVPNGPPLDDGRQWVGAEALPAAT